MDLIERIDMIIVVVLVVLLFIEVCINILGKKSYKKREIYVTRRPCELLSFRLKEADSPSSNTTVRDANKEQYLDFLLKNIDTDMSEKFDAVESRLQNRG